MRIKRSPVRGRATVIGTITNLPGGEPRCARWLMECVRLRRAIQARMTGERHCEPYVLHQRMMRIAHALKSLERKYPPVGQAFQPVSVPVPAPDGTPKTPNPGAHLCSGGSALSPTNACPTNICDEFGPTSVFTRSPAVSHDEPIWRAGSRGLTTGASVDVAISAGRRSTSGLTPRRSPWAPQSRTEACIYAATSASRHGQAQGRQAFALKSPARRFSSRRSIVGFTNRCSGPVHETRCRGPPTAGTVSTAPFRSRFSPIASRLCAFRRACTIVVCPPKWRVRGQRGQHKTMKTFASFAP